MYSGLEGVLEGGCLLWLGLGKGLETDAGGSMYETLGVGFEEVALEVGSVQWLMMVESVFDTSLTVTEARGVFRRGVSARNIWMSQL